MKSPRPIVSAEKAAFLSRRPAQSQSAPLLNRRGSGDWKRRRGPKCSQRHFQCADAINLTQSRLDLATDGNIRPRRVADIPAQVFAEDFQAKRVAVKFQALGKMGL